MRAAGVEDRVTVLGSDYRDLAGRFDKLVSLEMIEAVGWQYFDVFFRRCSELLEPHGLFFLQAIVIEDGAYEAEKRARSFANQLIFPGGCLPSLEVIQRHLARDTDMRTTWLDDISPSYVLTLRAWRERFVAATEQLEALGYDERVPPALEPVAGPLGGGLPRGADPRPAARGGEAGVAEPAPAVDARRRFTRDGPPVRPTPARPPPAGRRGSPDGRSPRGPRRAGGSSCPGAPRRRTR